MRGQVSKDPILSKTSTRESPMKIVSDHSPPHPEIKNTPDNLTANCGKEINESIDDTAVDLLDTSSRRDETVPEYVDPNTALVTHRSTWINSLAEHLWQEKRRRKRDHKEEDNNVVTL